MGKICNVLKTGKILVSDGAWGTFLQKKGLQPGECPEAWVLDRFDDNVEIAASYIKAGADMVESNSFGANRFKLEYFGKDNLVSEINEKAAAASRLAAGDKFVIASIGPTGKLLLMGDVTEEEMYEAFREQAAALERGGADAVCIETMSDAEEACLAIMAAKENTSLEIISTFTFELTKTGEYRTMMGLRPVDAAAAALEAGADIIGANCGNGIERMIDIVKEMKAEYPDEFILVHANAGLPEKIDGVDVFPESPELMASRVSELIKAGANIIGGCCGTTPEHISAIAAEVNKYNQR